MIAEHDPDLAASRIAAAIGEPARARILYCLMDGHARTSTELATIADVAPSTASSHLNRLVAEHLIKVLVQGKHRYYSLNGRAVARVLEGLNTLAGATSRAFVPSTPNRLRNARTCYDHMAGSIAVALHDRLIEARWLTDAGDGGYDVSAKGATELAALGVDVAAARSLRRRFAYACIDWSERRPHVGGAIGAALLELALRKRWVEQDEDSRALTITKRGETCLRRGLARA
jgi:DNA-binding transcriptional ArsR family regulator